MWPIASPTRPLTSVGDSETFRASAIPVVMVRSASLYSCRENPKMSSDRQESAKGTTLLDLREQHQKVGLVANGQLPVAVLALPPIFEKPKNRKVGRDHIQIFELVKLVKRCFERRIEFVPQLIRAEEAVLL